MLRRVVFALIFAVAVGPAAAAAATPAPRPDAAERHFLAVVMHALPARYPTPAAANAAGWIRYTNEDRTGAISYVNVAYWNSPDPLHPAQLWYDARGRLIGADYSVLRVNAPRGAPSILGMQPSRDITIPAHVHFVLCDGARCTYGKAISAKAYAAANNGSFARPTAAGLVRAGAVPSAAAVRTVFLYPAIYDVEVWVVPNPDGQFAGANPKVVPSAAAGKGEAM